MTELFAEGRSLLVGRRIPTLYEHKTGDHSPVSTMSRLHGA